MTQATRAMVILINESLVGGRGGQIIPLWDFDVVEPKIISSRTFISEHGRQGGEKDSGMKKGMPYSCSNSREQVITFWSQAKPF